MMRESCRIPFRSPAKNRTGNGQSKGSRNCSRWDWAASLPRRRMRSCTLPLYSIPLFVPGEEEQEKERQGGRGGEDKNKKQEIIC